jgi:hypothetical protein
VEPVEIEAAFEDLRLLYLRAKDADSYLCEDNGFMDRFRAFLEKEGLFNEKWPGHFREIGKGRFTGYFRKQDFGKVVTWLESTGMLVRQI